MAPDWPCEMVTYYNYQPCKLFSTAIKLKYRMSNMGERNPLYLYFIIPTQFSTMMNKTGLTFFFYD